MKGFTIKGKTPEKLYRLEEEHTTGWYEVGTNLPQQKCKELYDAKLNEGISPTRLRISRIA